jgi:short-subunit dehydrogenase
VYRLNLLTPMHLCRELIQRMLERKRGHIVNMSSIADMVAAPGLVTYCTTKAGLTHFTAALRADLRGLPIATTVVEIGTVKTDMLARLDDYGPTRRSVKRLYRLQLLADVPVGKVADKVVTAVQNERRYVRLPRRGVPFGLLVEAPRRVMELALTGVRAQD